jgi:acylphosphatase
MGAGEFDRCEVVFRGRVQGVGFRHTTKAIATHYPVTGYVQNQVDGTVLMIAEGRRDDVSRLIQAILAEMSMYATSHTEAWSSGSRAFSGFEIRSSLR